MKQHKTQTHHKKLNNTHCLHGGKFWVADPYELTVSKHVRGAAESIQDLACWVEVTWVLEALKARHTITVVMCVNLSKIHFRLLCVYNKSKTWVVGFELNQPQWKQPHPSTTIADIYWYLYLLRHNIKNVWHVLQHFPKSWNTSHQLIIKKTRWYAFWSGIWCFTVTRSLLMSNTHTHTLTLTSVCQSCCVSGVHPGRDRRLSSQR